MDLEGDILILEIVGRPIFDEIGKDWEMARGKPLDGHQCHVLTNDQATALNRAFLKVLFGMRELKSEFYSKFEDQA